MIDLVQRSTIHGINHIYSSKDRISKLFWLFLFLFGLGGISVNVVFVATKYLSNPIILIYTLNYEPFIWPDLTFCSPTNPFNFVTHSSILDHWLQVRNQSKEIAEILGRETEIFRIIRNVDNSDMELEERTITMASTDQQKLQVDDVSSQVRFIYYTKKHKGMYFFKEFDDQVPTLLKEDLKLLFNTQIIQILNNFPCRTFHIEKSKMADQNDLQMLKFGLRFDFKSYEIFNSSYQSRSIWLYISNKNEIPGKPFVLIPGFTNIIKLTQSRYLSNGLRRPCRREIFKVQLYDALLQSVEEFEGDMDDCKKIVSQEIFVKKCGCYSPFLPIYKNKSGFPKICLNATMFSKTDVLRNARCMVNVYKQYENESAFGEIFIERCGKYETIKCDALTYKTDQRRDMSVEMWTNTTNKRRRNELKAIYKFHFNESNDPYITSTLRDNLLWLHLERESEYGDLYKEQQEYPFSELLSDIGGLMGLWLGMSVVGLFEVLLFLYLYISDTILIRRRNKKNFKATLYT